MKYSFEIRYHSTKVKGPAVVQTQLVTIETEDNRMDAETKVRRAVAQAGDVLHDIKLVLT